MRRCALCKVPAKTFCDSDQAFLCWDCDAKVHSANFLVARHLRNLLCHDCQCPTPWTASGAKLGHTVSVCNNCVSGVQTNNGGPEEGSRGNDDDDMPDEDGDSDREDGDGEDDDVVREDDGGSDSDGGGEGDGDNQVVPWSSTTAPPAASSSSSGESTKRL